jgi:hypothetical protein
MQGVLRRLGAVLPHGKTLPEEQWRARHHGLVLLLWAHVVALPIVALLYGFSLGHSLLEGSGIAAFGVLALLRMTVTGDYSLSLVREPLTVEDRENLASTAIWAVEEDQRRGGPPPGGE